MNIVSNRRKKQEAVVAVKPAIAARDDSQLELFEIDKQPEPDKEVFLTAKNTVTIREEPYRPVKQFSLDRSSISPGPRERYLIVGFDTEYQPLQPSFTSDEVKEGAARYEVLSYQFHAIQLDGSQWSGIAVPNQNARLTFAQFLIYALAAGAEQGQRIPETVILVGHYTRADVPAFDDRDQVYDRVRNVRNSLVSGHVPIAMKISFSDDTKDVHEIKVYLRDTMLLAPSGRQSLAALGELVGQQKIKLAETPQEERLIKRRMKVLRDNDWPRFRRYALLDAEISALYLREVTSLYQAATGDGFVPSVLSTIGVELLQLEWKCRAPPVEPTRMVGQEVYKEEVWNENTAQFNTKTHKPYIEEVNWHVALATECYHGGRAEQFWFGPSFADNWSDVDLTSAYPVAMATINTPAWEDAYVSSDIDEIVLGCLAFVCVDFCFPDSVRYPMLPVRTQNGLIFPLAGRSYCCAPEIQVARDLGCALTVRHAVVIPQKPDEKVFFPFIKETIRKRREAAPDIEKAFWKEVTNSCYGKTAQGLVEKRVFGLRDKKSEKIRPSAITNPFYAAHITSFVRAAIGEVMNRIPMDRVAFSVTTDGFTTNSTAEELEAAKQGPVMQLYREAVIGLTGSDQTMTEKHAVKQLLGWRARGQATLIKGDAPDQTSIVLAKAGVRPPVEYGEVADQNDYMVNLFFSRTPVTTVENDVHTTMADMIKHGADLVSKKSVKRLNMEYDFKRRPHAVRTTAVTSPSGEKYEHIAFSTRPWRDVAEFKMVRRMWDQYRRAEKVCLKTVADYQQFAKFFEMMLSLPDGSGKYLRRSDKTGLQRLQRDLCRAFKHQQAGFEMHGNMSARQFADVLNSTSMPHQGVVTEVATVENGKRAAFKPRTTPPTREVFGVLEELRAHFPSLDVNAIVSATNPSQVQLSVALGASCPFIEKLPWKQRVP